MSISNPEYTRSYIREWLAVGTERGRRFITKAAEEQYGNLKQLLWDRKRHGRVPTWCKLEDYCQSVRMLRAAAREIRKTT